VLEPVRILAVSPGLPATAVTLTGSLATLTWLTWRFGPTLLRLAGFCSLWIAWACGSQGGYGYCLFFLALGTLAWGTGTVWYAKRRGRWPSAVSERLLTGVLGRRSPLAQNELPSDSAVVPLRRP
jgi:hypothetical protein